MWKMITEGALLGKPNEKYLLNCASNHSIILMFIFNFTKITFYQQQEEEDLVEKILIQPDIIDNQTNDGCSVASFASTVSILFFIFYLSCKIHIQSTNRYK